MKKIKETAKSSFCKKKKKKKMKPIAETEQTKNVQEITFALIFEMQRSVAINLQLDKRLMVRPK